MWLFVASVPVTLFSYAMLRNFHNHSGMIFGMIAVVFLLPAIIDFIANKVLRLKAAILVSAHGLMVSPSKGLYDSFAFLQIFLPGRKKLIHWQHITGFQLLVQHKYITSYPNEGEGTASKTYSEARHQLCIGQPLENDDIIFSLHDLDRTPDEILAICNQFLREYGNKN